MSDLYSRKFTGANYDETKDMNMSDVCKLIRKDIKKAIKAGDLPAELKTSVRLSRFSGGCSVSCTIKAWDGKIYNRTRLAAETLNPYRHSNLDYRTDEAVTLVNRLQTIISSYNYDNSESMVDYFDNRYYTNVDIDYSLEKVDRAAGLAELSKSELRIDGSDILIQVPLKTITKFHDDGEGDKLVWYAVAQFKTVEEVDAAVKRLADAA